MKKLFIFFLLLMSGMLYAQKDSVNIDEDFLFIDPYLMPEFPGGETAMYKFISENIRYPKEAMENAVQGRVFVMFVINEDGSISNLEVVKGVSPSLDAEALRVVGLMPKWKPAEQSGNP